MSVLRAALQNSERGSNKDDDSKNGQASALCLVGQKDISISLNGDSDMESFQRFLEASDSETESLILKAQKPPTKVDTPEIQVQMLSSAGKHSRLTLPGSTYDEAYSLCGEESFDDGCNSVAESIPEEIEVEDEAKAENETGQEQMKAGGKDAAEVDLDPFECVDEQVMQALAGYREERMATERLRIDAEVEEELKAYREEREITERARIDGDILAWAAAESCRMEAVVRVEHDAKLQQLMNQVAQWFELEQGWIFSVLLQRHEQMWKSWPPCTDLDKIAEMASQQQSPYAVPDESASSDTWKGTQTAFNSEATATLAAVWQRLNQVESECSELRAQFSESKGPTALELSSTRPTTAEELEADGTSIESESCQQIQAPCIAESSLLGSECHNQAADPVEDSERECEEEQAETEEELKQDQKEEEQDDKKEDQEEEIENSHDEEKQERAEEIDDDEASDVMHVELIGDHAQISDGSGSEASDHFSCTDEDELLDKWQLCEEPLAPAEDEAVSEHVPEESGRGLWGWGRRLLQAWSTPRA